MWNVDMLEDEEKVFEYVESLNSKADTNKKIICSQDFVYYSYQSPLSRYISSEMVYEMSFEDFMEKTSEYMFEDPLEYIYFVLSHYTEEMYFDNDGIPLMKEVTTVCQERQVDYKRGYESNLYIFQPDYKELKIKKPKNSDIPYIGVQYSTDNWGEISGFNIFRVKEQKRKVVVTEWVSV